MLRRLPLLLVLALSSACSLRMYAINMVGDTLASGDSVYEIDDDIDLVVDALPFGLKLTESLLTQSPSHPGLLLTACRGFVLYSYAYVDYESELVREQDLDRALALRARAAKLYLRAAGYGFRALERSYPGLGAALLMDPTTGAMRVDAKHQARDVPVLYWTAAALGLAISASKNDAALVARLPEVEALLNRALALDETWNDGALHEFAVTFAAAKPGGAMDSAAITAHYERAYELSKGMSAGLYISYAEAVWLPRGNKKEFRAMLERAMAIDPGRAPRERLATVVAQRRAHWLLTRIDTLFLDETVASERGGK